MPPKQPTKPDQPIKPEDILVVVQDQSVMDILVERLKSLLPPLVETVISQYTASISATIDEIVETKTAEHFVQHSKKMTDRIDALETENMALRKNVSDLDNCNRLDTLIIHGIRESALIATASTLEQSDQDSDVSEDLCQTVLQLCNNRLELDLTCSDILSAYRIRQQKKTVCRPILVKFKTRSARDSVYAARKLLRPPPNSDKSSAVYVNENLTKHNAGIFAEARKLVRLKKLASSWTMNGMVYVKIGITKEERPQRVSQLSELPHE